MKFYKSVDGEPTGGNAPDDPEVKKPEDKEPEVPEDVDPGQVFLSELNRLAGALKNNPVVPAETPPKDKVVEPSQKGIKVPEGDEDFESLFTDRAKFDSFVKSIVSQTKEETRKEILNELPSHLKKVVNEELTFDRAASNFWLKNEDLLPAEEFIASRASVIAAQNPEMKLQKVFEQAGKEVRDSLASMGVDLKTEGNSRKPKGRKSSIKSTSKDPDNDVRALAARRLNLQ